METKSFPQSNYDLSIAIPSIINGNFRNDLIRFEILFYFFYFYWIVLGHNFEAILSISDNIAAIVDYSLKQLEL